MVSNDTVITITFGLVSIIISFASMLIAYLTLRAMPTEHDQNIDRPLENGTTFRHEHTYFLADCNTSTGSMLEESKKSV
ncbi:uncharacterized protein PAC_15059 [Phialocephala subalpina]|uniref:Uncharacterized protein n=1 Tax=Phialocephala subalpina TaxID=576137 RepID=A0A1L7XJE6_9HELO|nr:uncharacterized protein PAC_15059 [Phialocephala subalpina]